MGHPEDKRLMYIFGLPVEYSRGLEVKDIFLSSPFPKLGFDASTVAYAAHCQQESSLDRPVAGHTNICPGAIKNTTKDIESLSSTIKHELLHALGFSSSLFAFFRDKASNWQTPMKKNGWM